MENKMYRKAAIYIRTSSEAQGEKASPTEQEADCRLLAKEKGLTVVRIYRDIQKYRVKNRACRTFRVTIGPPRAACHAQGCSQG